MEQFVDGVKHFLTSGRDETAGIEDDELDIWGVRIGRIEELICVGRKKFTKEKLAIDEVFGTS
jgi:hypothetical protein